MKSEDTEANNDYVIHGNARANVTTVLPAGYPDIDWVNLVIPELGPHPQIPPRKNVDA